MKKNIIDKIWEAHVVESNVSGPDVLFIDRHLVHEVTSPQAFSVLRERNLPVLFPEKTISTVDHSIPTDPERKNYKDAQTQKQVETLRKNVRDFGIECYDFGSGYQGIVHVMAPELGVSQPGRIMVCGDSHTATHGAFGALAFGIGTSQVLCVLATQSLLLEKPKTMKVEFRGKPSPYFSAKDAILECIRVLGIQGGTGYAMEFCGDYIRNLSMEGRMTLCNMGIECGARFALISPDQKTFDYLEGRKLIFEVGENLNFEEKVEDWKAWVSHDDAEYDTSVVIDLEGKKPIVTWGTNPEQGVSVGNELPVLSDLEDEAKKLAAQKALDYTGLDFGQKIEGLAIDFVFVGSCTNGRIEDFRVVAEILKGKKISDRVTLFIVPGSEAVRAQCIEEGLDKIFVQSGADFRMSGCSMCLAMNGDQVPEGKRCASTSNRNFVGRQGFGSITHLMSPLMAALCAVHGKVMDPEKILKNKRL